ncbi:GNAT family N-acetyltransferase [Mycolicibacterium aichiense]|uniref:Lysine N-acyltransferase MbtK n=1 Tax=Mycolicibacterium aichiense TaxID=1799 RepID=A0AAD1HRK8_9MYCO|nr:GNAT family N-acetyltransferase [Mycolicibacterium aichiense]MCV7017135.1 acetyltransferase [Mycolicibacterium aichiense]BBX10437.1 lysine N-acyltransferase MbtK [Mycolicibacterium aichiense]STZ25905.1 Gcn5-related N-acetyltransferase [Mycolicibacterium aichiense]
MNEVVLARARADLPLEVARVPAPVVPTVDPPYGIRAATAADADMVAEWMSRPHLAQAWEYDWPVDRWRRHLQAQLDGTYSLPLIVSLGGADDGYLELYRAAKDSIAPCYDADPYDLGLHAAIANTGLLNRGVGLDLLPQIIANLFAVEPQCRRVMFDPDHRNAAARRVCEAAGCEFLGEFDMSNRRMALYAFERAAELD